jgi:prevent-host-death family protein
VVGLRELRQHASQLVSRAESGEVVTVTVSGRPAAQLVPVSRRAWRRWSDLSMLYAHRGAGRGWDEDRAPLDQAPHDPWISR